MQLTPWAAKTMNTREIADEIRRRAKMADLELYYPVIEDVVGKHQTAYDEYVFLENHPDIPLQEMEGNEILKQFLRDAKGNPCLLPDADIQKIRQQIEAEELLRPKERVLINKGALRGNHGEVRYADDGQVILTVNMGDESVEAAMPQKWVRRKGRRRRPEGESPNQKLAKDLDIPELE